MFVAIGKGGEGKELGFALDPTAVSYLHTRDDARVADLQLTAAHQVQKQLELLQQEGRLGA